jgi:CheY-like chemotaxis protein
MRLPAEVRDPTTEPVRTTVSQAQAEGESTVLVIDDDVAVRDLLQRFLGKEGFHVVSASGGEEGLRLARELRPDAITLDVMMPGMDGWAVLSALKADPHVSDIPVIMLTLIDDKNLGYTLGAADYLTKPINRDRLVSLLEKYQRNHSPCRVLIVEDDPSSRRTLHQILKMEGFEVAEAENGRVALERVVRSRPSVILLDLMMPQMDGFEFVADLRSREEWRTIPVVVATAKDITQEDRLRLNGYVTQVIQKGTYSRDALLAEVRDLLRTYRVRQGSQ